MEKEALVSVCIPVYNAESFIKNTINCVLAQSYAKIELLIVDNCSTDKTVDIIKSFDDPRIRLVVNDKNYGMVANWNACLKLASGKYIQILCADDVIDNKCIEDKVTFISEHNDVAIVFSASKICDANGKTRLQRRPFKKDRIFNGKEFTKKSFRYKNLYGEPSNVLFTSEAVSRAGEFDGNMGYSLDWEYWLRLSLSGNVGYIDRELSTFRISEDSTTSKMLDNKKNIIQSDKLFIQKCMKNKEFGFGKTDAFWHAVMTRLLLFGKDVIVRWINK